MSRRPTFGQWLKGTWLDIVTMACMGAIGLGVSLHRPKLDYPSNESLGLLRKARPRSIVPRYLFRWRDCLA